jgi:hypothetical protein
LLVLLALGAASGSAAAFVNTPQPPGAAVQPPGRSSELSSQGGVALPLMEGEVIYAYDWEEGLFQNGYAGWQVGDSDPQQGEHYWDDDSDAGARAHGGSLAMHCADYVNGAQSGTPQTYYDAMEAYAMHKVDLSGWTTDDTIRASFYTWYQTEPDHDWLEFWVSDANAAPGSWQQLEKLSGASSGWVQRTFDFGPYAGQSDIWIAIQFASDGAGHGYEGAYVDDLVVSGRRALTPPVLKEPARDSAVCDLTPLFRWQAVAGATSYELEVDDDQAFGSPAIDADTTQTSYTPTSALATGGYAWRVRGVDDRGGGPWSAVWRFSAAGAEPAAPKLSQPQDGAVLCNAPYTFRWSSAAGATSCTIEVDDDPAFRSPEVQLSGATYCTGKAVVSQALAPGTYHWRVLATNACGEGPWSAVGQFSVLGILEAPARLAPANGSGSGDPTPTFRWAALPGALTYRLQVDDQSSFSSTEVDAVTGEVSYTPTASLAPGDYHWRVRAGNECGDGPWSSPAWQFTVESDTVRPGQVDDLAARSGSASGTVELRWTAPGDDGLVGRASAYEVRYNLVAVTEDNWDRSARAAAAPAPGPAGTSEVMVVAGLIPDQVYFFAIKTLDEVPNQSEISNSAYGRATGYPGWRQIYLPVAGR